jgi:hypothetical protein
MATGKRVWTAEAWINAAGAGSFDTLSGTTEEYTSTVDLATNGYDLVTFWCDLNFDATPTDDMDVKVYSSPDGGTDWDDIPIYTIRVDSATDPAQFAITIQNPPPTLRLGFVQTGSTDTHDFRCSYKAANWDIS